MALIRSPSAALERKCERGLEHRPLFLCNRRMANQRPRLASLDALRGFDMFWIVGGAAWIAELGEAFGWGWASWIGEQMHHPEWHGFAAYDLIFPLFLFISCVTLPFSLGRSYEWGEAGWTQYARIGKRVFLLVLLGAIYNGLLRFDWDGIRYASVLGRIGLAWGVVAILVIRLGHRGLLTALISIIIGYWALLRFGHAPGFEAGDLSMEGNIASYIDRQFLPGRLHMDIHDPEGLLSTLGAVGTGLMGALAGWWLKAHEPNGALKAAGLFLVGALVTGLGFVWSAAGDLPLNKNLWTSSFVLVTGGLSLGLLGLFYLLVDVWRLKPVFFFFIVIGMNPITIYLLEGRLVDFEKPAEFLFEGAIGQTATAYQDLLRASAVIGIEWLVLFFLYRKRVFLRV
jgi:predicted acyltransferase